MKPSSILSKLAALLALSLMANISLAADSADVSTLMAKAQRAYAAGDLTTARLDFQTVLQNQPLNQVAIAFLRRIDIAQKSSTGSLESELQKIMILKVDLKEATLSSIFPYLTQQIVKLSGGKVHPNFVVALPQSFQNKTTVTLSLDDVSVADTIHYIADLANIEFHFQQNAILITPVAVEPATAPLSGSSSSTNAQ